MSSDDWGAFDTAKVEPPPLPQDDNSVSPVSAAVAATKPSDDAWGDFSSSAVAPSSNSLDESPVSVAGLQQTTVIPHESQLSSTETSGNTLGDVAVVSKTADPGAEPQPVDSWGDFSASVALPIAVASSEQVIGARQEPEVMSADTLNTALGETAVPAGMAHSETGPQLEDSREDFSAQKGNADVQDTWGDFAKTATSEPVSQSAPDGRQVTESFPDAGGVPVEARTGPPSDAIVVPEVKSEAGSWGDFAQFSTGAPPSKAEEPTVMTAPPDVPAADHSVPDAEPENSWGDFSAPVQTDPPPVVSAPGIAEAKGNESCDLSPVPEAAPMKAQEPDTVPPLEASVTQAAPVAMADDSWGDFSAVTNSAPAASVPLATEAKTAAAVDEPHNSASVTPDITATMPSQSENAWGELSARAEPQATVANHEDNVTEPAGPARTAEAPTAEDAGGSEPWGDFAEVSTAATMPKEDSAVVPGTAAPAPVQVEGSGGDFAETSTASPNKQEPTVTPEAVVPTPAALAAAAAPVAQTNADDSWGDFSDSAAAPAAQAVSFPREEPAVVPETAVPPPLDASPAAPAAQTTADDSWGDFPRGEPAPVSSPKEEPAAVASRDAVPPSHVAETAPQSVPTAGDDSWGDFSDVAPAASSSGNDKAGTTKADSWGDFAESESAPAVPPSVQGPPAADAKKDDESWGDFSDAPADASAVSTAAPDPPAAPPSVAAPPPAASPSARDESRQRQIWAALFASKARELRQTPLRPPVSSFAAIPVKRYPDPSRLGVLSGLGSAVAAAMTEAVPKTRDSEDLDDLGLPASCDADLTPEEEEQAQLFISRLPVLLTPQPQAAQPN